MPAAQSEDTDSPEEVSERAAANRDHSSFSPAFLFPFSPGPLSFWAVEQKEDALLLGMVKLLVIGTWKEECGTSHSGEILKDH